MIIKDKPDRLWAPWRLEYIESAMRGPGGCFLCEAAGSSDDRKKLIIYRGELAFAVMNLYPYNNGHLLVAPYRHVGGLDKLTPEELSALGELTRTAVRWIDSSLEPDGYNIGLNLGRVAGAGLPEHIHIHIVPRWSGDANFMPVLCGTKVISEALASTYDKLKRAIDDKADKNIRPTGSN